MIAGNQVGWIKGIKTNKFQIIDSSVYQPKKKVTLFSNYISQEHKLTRHDMDQNNLKLRYISKINTTSNYDVFALLIDSENPRSWQSCFKL